MKSTHFFLVLLVVMLGASLLIPARYYKKEIYPRTLIENPEYLKSELPIETRIDDLLSYMTLEEKVGQMALVEKNSVLEPGDIAKYGLGALLSGAGANPENNSKEGWRDMVAGFLDESRESRLGIPILYGVDAVHGHANLPGATVFPHALGLGATGDTELVKRVAHATAEELRATRINWSFSPNLDLPHDIRWGRVYETFSDDPMLTGALGVAYVEGTQYTENDPSERIQVLSTPKHYLGAGDMQWGSAKSDLYKIDQGSTPPSEHALRTEYLLPYKAVVDAGALSIMIGLNSWGDTKLSASKYLVTDVLKGELGFTGFAVSDWYGVYEIPGSDYASAVKAINAGIDMVMLPFDYKPFIRNVVSAVKKGDIPQARVDDAVRRILRAKFASGLFDAPVSTPSLDTIGSNEHRTLARDAVAQSLVLLKNEGNILPIHEGVRHIRVAGSAADNIGRQSGAWTVEWQGIDGNWLPGATSILSAIRSRAGDGVRVEYDMNASFSSDGIADLGIAVIGEAPYAEGFGDRENPVLDAVDRETIDRLKRVSRNVVVVMVTGRPIIISNDIAKWDALVAAWLPGSEGDGVADVLFGSKPFRGRLPIPWPRSVGQLPVTKDGSTQDTTDLLFPRYYGLR